ncbi:MAG: ABC transporter substrate-binding protein [Phycisphaerae bacterium]|nr:ABC transporter substrate-binding protein [Phycisphaerae bacterium]
MRPSRKTFDLLTVLYATLMLTAFLPLGCSKKQPEKTEIRFGASFPLTGDVASYGQKAKRGIELAVEKVNSAGGLLGKTVAIDFQDDRNDKKEAVSIVRKFATVDQVPVVFGSAGSTVTLAIAPIANRNRVVLISPISSSVQLSKEGGDYFFRTCPGDDLQAEILANWVAASGATNAAVVYTNNSWGKPLAEGFEENFQKLGGKVLITEGVDESSSDFRTIVAKIKSDRNVDVVISPTYPKEGGIFVRQMQEAGANIPLYGGDNWGSPEFLTTAGDAAEGVYYTAPTEGVSSTYAQFAQEYQKKYSEDPDVFSAYAYDAAMAIFEAVRKCQSIEAERIKETMLSISFEGVSGKIAFKANGDLKSEAFAKKTIKSGKAVNVE